MGEGTLLKVYVGQVIPIVLSVLFGKSVTQIGPSVAPCYAGVRYRVPMSEREEIWEDGTLPCWLSCSAKKDLQSVCCVDLI